MTSNSDLTEHHDAIVVEHLSKKFRIPRERKYTIYDHIVGLLKGGFYLYDEFIALEDLSFSIQPGEMFGIIGPNGSGKSTLLKLLAGILYPDKGTITVDGRIAPFIELGVGFHPELTARENVFLNGSIMGLKEREIQNRYHEIFSFAELEQFENMKLKNFSSGMVIRLAFSTAIQTNPDILLLDEVFAVGDEHFQQKCFEKINELKERGVTIVFVSHSLESVQDQCERSLLLVKGKMIQLGKTSEVIETYLQMVQ